MVSASIVAKPAEQASLLFHIFAELYDDAVLRAAQHDGVSVGARLVRALKQVAGEDIVEQSLARWAAEGSIELLGSADTLDAEQSCVRIVDYVSGPVTPTI